MADVSVQPQAVGGAYAPPTVSRPARISSLDIVRGVVMVLMAIDHVRVYSGVPAGGPTPGVFFTRWITHFVAPGFAFFAGTSIYLHGLKLGDRKALSTFLVSRGAWLVLLELTVIRVCWTFNFDFSHYLLAGVIWMLGWCMILMAALVHLSPRVNGIVGLVIIAGHNALGALTGGWETVGNGATNALWQVLYGGNLFTIGGANGPPLFILYVLVPWIGVMMAGYWFGTIMTRPAPERNRLILRIGLVATVAFVALRAIDVYGDQNHWRQRPEPAASAQTQTPPQQARPPRPQAPAPIRFLATSKYPASLDFLLMTLGPLLILLAYADRIRGAAATVLETFGRVPFFYYLLHIPLIHLAACVVSLIRAGTVVPWLFANHPVNPGPAPDGYRWSLGLLYLVWFLCVAALYIPCRWYARVRATNKNPLLSYL